MRARHAFLLLLATSGIATAQEPDTTVRRRVVTPELERSAFKDEPARALLRRARAARVAQDSALRAYDATSYMRLSIGLGVRKLGPERLLMRTEHSARVRWSRGGGAWVRTTGRRSAFPMGKAEVDFTGATPIPYFPGRESLWIPSGDFGVTQIEVNEDDEWLHPLATGAEAYYRYETGDSVSINLPDGGRVALRELRITAREPSWRTFVGSFWFDVDRGNLVRAAYRLAADLDVWQAAKEDEQEQREEDVGDRIGAWIAEGIFSPLRVRVSAITLEYGLHEGRFWLPRSNVTEGEAVAGPLRVPMRYEEHFTYRSVNGDAPAAVPVAGEMDLQPGDTTFESGGNMTIASGGSPREGATTLSDSAQRARDDQRYARELAMVDSALTRADSARAARDTAAERRLRAAADRHRSTAHRMQRRRQACARGDSTYLAGIATRFGGAVRMAIRMPCDTSGFATSADLPESIYGDDEGLFGASERDALLDALGFSLQPGWSPQAPTLHAGLDLMRYNRIEGLSPGVSATSLLGKGYTVGAVARVGLADLVPNGELHVSRSNGRAEARLGVYRRLAVANDDWGAPLSFGASLSNLLYARDEGFYYRAWGAELAGTRDAPGPLAGATIVWRLFAERQLGAGTEPKTQGSLANAIGNSSFQRNIQAEPLRVLGASGELARSFGANPVRLRLDTHLRFEGALADPDSAPASRYGRVMAEGTLSRVFGSYSAAITAGAGTSAGDLPLQRAFFIGGLHTVRGQYAQLDSPGRVGNAFWLTRAELGLGGLVMRPSLFYDVGWAGAREDFSRPARPLSGAGFGLSLLDGLIRFDLSRGIWPEHRWRFDASLGARF